MPDLLTNHVQAADFSILAIAIITLLTITRTTYMPDASLVKKILICASVWFVPTTTGKSLKVGKKTQAALIRICSIYSGRLEPIETC